MKVFKESGGGVGSSKDSSKKSSKKPSQKNITTPVKSGSFISKEFIESDDDTSLSEDDDKNIKGKTKEKSKQVLKILK